MSTSGRVVVKGGGVALDLREASGGEVLFESGAGSARVGVVEGTTVQLDLTSGMRTGSGDVVVSRATADIA